MNKIISNPKPTLQEWHRFFVPVHADGIILGENLTFVTESQNKTHGLLPLRGLAGARIQRTHRFTSGLESFIQVSTASKDLRDGPKKVSDIGLRVKKACNLHALAAQPESLVELLPAPVFISDVQVNAQYRRALGAVILTRAKLLQPFRRLSRKLQTFIGMTVESGEDHAIMSDLRHPQKCRSIAGSRADY